MILHFLVAGAGRNGSRAVVWDNSDPQHYAFASQKMAAEPGAGVVFSGWIKAERGDIDEIRPKIQVDWSDVNGKWMSARSASRVIDGRRFFPLGMPEYADRFGVCPLVDSGSVPMSFLKAAKS